MGVCVIYNSKTIQRCSKFKHNDKFRKKSLSGSSINIRITFHVYFTDLLGAIHERSLPELIRSVTLVKERGHEHKMVAELREATKMMERLQQIQNLLHDVRIVTMSDNSKTTRFLSRLDLSF